ncbi:MAG: FAD-dependent oxidoreductase [Chitinophagales bacterium]
MNGIPNDVLLAGRIAVNEFNQVKGFDNIFAIGDVAACADKENPKGLPMLAPVAMQQADLLSKNLIRLAKDKALKPLNTLTKV